MIRELSIKNLALIDTLTIEFHRGFSVFTGETGAGKSILIGAIGLILGERASTESIRSGCEQSEIAGTFELEEIAVPLRKLLDRADIPLEENTLIIRRIITKTGRNRIHVNQVPTPLSTLKSIGDYLVDFHGQHQHQSLLKPETAVILINSLPGVAARWKSFQTAYTDYCTTRSKLETFDKKAAETHEKRDLIEFQYTELADMALQPDEEKLLEDEYAMHSTTTERLTCVSSIASAIEDSHDDHSLERQVSRIKKALETLRKFDSSAEPWIGDIETISTYFSELQSYCNSYLATGDAQANPVRLEQINGRLAKIQRLKKKYHCSFAGLLETLRILREQLDSIENVTADRRELEKRAAAAEKRCEESGKELSQSRRQAAQAFDRAVTEQMAVLGFSGGKWRTVFTPAATLTPSGLEDIHFEVQTNRGEPFLPLIKTASGGEISRCMLAIKTILSSQDNIPILIFDEIDAGIGGLLAKEVANALYTLRESHQVLCISHLHQIASLADHHYHVFKTSKDNRTLTRVEKLTDKEKVEEISRMLGSDSTLSKKHAQELLSGK